VARVVRLDTVGTFNLQLILASLGDVVATGLLVIIQRNGTLLIFGIRVRVVHPHRVDADRWRTYHVIT
jgi:hypothetical protein